MIRVRNLSKSFGRRPVLTDLDLDVAEGDCLALLGPNGAGKTTLLRIIAALSKPASGSVRVAGVDLRQDPISARKQIGFLSHQPLLYGDLSAEENLMFYARMYDVHNPRRRIQELLTQVGLASYRHDPVRTFSRGMTQRLAIARAFLHDPSVLLLDEPYTGLDRQAAAMLDRVLHAVGLHARTVILTTHELEHAWRVSNRAALLVGGRIVYGQTRDARDPAAFRREYERYLPIEGFRT